jgi:hypothetical protein
VDSSSERSGETRKSPTIKDKAIVGAAIVALVASMGGGAKSAYNAMHNEEKAEDQNRRAIAAANIRCIEVSHSPAVIRRENGRAIVKLTDLSPSQKADCFLDRVEDDLDGWDPRTSGVFLPLDAEVVKPSVEVKLPSSEVLRNDAEEELSRANNGMTVLDGVERYSMAGMGAFIGAGVLIMGAAGAAAGVDRLRRR